MIYPPFGPFGFAQGPERLDLTSSTGPVEGLRLRPLALRVSLERVRKHPVETRIKVSPVVAGAYSRISKIRE